MRQSKHILSKKIYNLTQKNEVFMLKKFFSFAFIISTLSYHVKIKAMEERNPQTEKVSTLKDLAIVATNKYRSDPKYQDNETLDLNCLPLDLQDYYKHTIIKKYYNTLKLASKNFLNGHLFVSGNNLNEHFELIQNLASLIVNIEPILSIINNDFFDLSSRGYLTMNDINVFLSFLITQTYSSYNAIDNTVPIEKLVYPQKIMRYAFQKRKANLCKLLVEYNLLPALDHVIDRDVNENFLMYLIKYPINIKIFLDIININKNRERDYWKKLFNTFSTDGTVIHYAISYAYGLASNNLYLRSLLEIMKAKALITDELINRQNQAGLTALMKAVRNCNDEAVQLLIENKANVNLKCKKGLTALDYAKDGEGSINHQLNPANPLFEYSDVETLEKAKSKCANCIKLLVNNGAKNSCQFFSRTRLF